MDHIEAINLIATNPEIRSGRPCIAGTSIEVAAIAVAKIIHGQSPEEIASDYRLSLPQVYAALAYYYDRKDQIDRSIKERKALAREMWEKRVGSRHPPLSG